MGKNLVDPDRQMSLSTEIKRISTIVKWKQSKFLKLPKVKI